MDPRKEKVLNKDGLSLDLRVEVLRGTGGVNLVAENVIVLWYFETSGDN